MAEAQWIINLGLWYVISWFFFPHALLEPIAAVVAVLYAGGLLLPLRVTLDPDRGELAITMAFWTRHVPLTRVTRVDEIGRLGARISAGDGVSYGITPFERRRWPAGQRYPRQAPPAAGVRTEITPHLGRVDADRHRPG